MDAGSFVRRRKRSVSALSDQDVAASGGACLHVCQKRAPSFDVSRSFALNEHPTPKREIGGGAVIPHRSSGAKLSCGGEMGLGSIVATEHAGQSAE